MLELISAFATQKFCSFESQFLFGNDTQSQNFHQ